MSLNLLSLTWRLNGCFYSWMGRNQWRGSGSQKIFLEFFIEAYRAGMSKSGKESVSYIFFSGFLIVLLWAIDRKRWRNDDRMIPKR